MEVSGQLEAPATLPMGKTNTSPNGEIQHSFHWGCLGRVEWLLWWWRRTIRFHNNREFLYHLDNYKLLKEHHVLVHGINKLKTQTPRGDLGIRRILADTSVYW